MSSSNMNPSSNSQKLSSTSASQELPGVKSRDALPMSSSEMNPTINPPEIQSSSPLFKEIPDNETLSMSSDDIDWAAAAAATTTYPHRYHPAASTCEEFPGALQSRRYITAGFVGTITAIFKKIKSSDFPISIFKIPDSMTCAKPEAYIPQRVGLGPLHHLRHELQHMQMHKVVVAKRIHNGFKSGLGFDEVIDFLNQMVGGPYVRASYSIYLEMEDDVLACIMAVDGLFLFDLLCGSTGIKINSEANQANTSSLYQLVNPDGRLLAQEATIQEAMMLENQIPIFVLKYILLIEGYEKDWIEKITTRDFPEILLGFCQHFSPLKTVKNYPPLKALKHAHLLDLLYHLVTLKHPPEIDSSEAKTEEMNELNQRIQYLHFLKSRSDLAAVMSRTERFELSTKTDKLFHLAKELAPPGVQKPIELLQGLLALPLSDVRSSIASARKKVVLPAKETFIPRASELNKAGVKFSYAVHITDIDFDPDTVCFHLPVITIKPNFEVVIRNLVVYEAIVKSTNDPPILSWYVELMNGLVQTAEDVRVLTKEKIISKPESINDERVARIFSEMNKAVELTNIPKSLDDAVSGVKHYYNNVCRVSMSKFMNKWWQSVSKWGKVVVVLLVLFLLAVQTFCSAYECRRFTSNIKNTFQAERGLRPPSLRSRLN